MLMRLNEFLMVFFFVVLIVFMGMGGFYSIWLREPKPLDLDLFAKQIFTLFGVGGFLLFTVTRPPR